MKTFFQIKNNALIEGGPDQADVAVYTIPDNGEKQELLDTLGHDAHDLESALDPDEISRIEINPDDTYIIWKRPNNVSYEQHLKFEVSSVGLFIKGNRMTVILGDASPAFRGKEFQKIESTNNLLLKFFLQTIHHYLGHLKVIKQLTAEIQTKLNLSMENRYLIQMFVLSESLVYYLNAIEANSAVLAKLRASAPKISFTQEEMEMLDDIIIEHQQCERQTQIYSSVMAGLMDARGAIINNNMNVLLKNLTIINVVFLPLNLIAGIGGMSEFSMMTQGIDWKISYFLFVGMMAVFGWILWIRLARLNRPSQSMSLRKKSG